MDEVKLCADGARPRLLNGQAANPQYFNGERVE